MGRKIPIEIESSAKSVLNKLPEQSIESVGEKESMTERIGSAIQSERKIEARNFSLSSTENKQESPPLNFTEFTMLIVVALWIGYLLAKIFM